MTIGEELKTLLGPIFEGRFYPTWAPNETARPYGVYVRLQNPEPPPTLDNKRNIQAMEYEISAWSETFDESDELGREVVDALISYRSPTIQLIESQGRDDIADPETTLRASRVRCLIYTTEV